MIAVGLETLRRQALLFAVFVLLVAVGAPIQAQIAAQSQVIIPTSSLPRTADFSVRAHSNFWICQSTTGSTAIVGETPSKIRQVYGLPPLGGSGTIAIVCAYHYPTALADFNVFSKQFGLPRETSKDPMAVKNKVLQVVYARGTQPAVDAGWSMEACLDIQWAHAMAPNAKIVLVESASNTYVDLFQAVDVANAQSNVKQVSLSWGGGEFSGETVWDSHMKKAGVVYVAGSGDVGGNTIYPSVSQYVVSVGGTAINRNAKGVFTKETGWINGGGGPSLFVPIPSYQSSAKTVKAKCGAYRGTPDISFNADLATGCAIYDSTPYSGLSGWIVVGGTSLSAPALAGILNLSHSFNGFKPKSTNDQLTTIYKNLGKAQYFRDIVTGTAGTYSCTTGWDFITGVGSPLGTQGK